MDILAKNPYAFVADIFPLLSRQVIALLLFRTFIVSKKHQ